MMYNYGMPPPQAAPPKPKKPKRYGLIALLVLFGLTISGVTTYVLLMRLSDTVLAVLATVMVAVAAGAPTTILALSVLMRKANNGKQSPQPQMTSPVVTVMPPMAWPQLPQQPQQPPPIWEQAPPIARRYTVVGDEGDF